MKGYMFRNIKWKNIVFQDALLRGLPVIGCFYVKARSEKEAEQLVENYFNTKMSQWTIRECNYDERIGYLNDNVT